MFWKLIWKLDKYAHLSGSFLLMTVALHIMPTPWAVASLIIGNIGLELYQWQHQRYYVGKEMDTALDLIADGVGIMLAVVL